MGSPYADTPAKRVVECPKCGERGVLPKEFTSGYHISHLERREDGNWSTRMCVITREEYNRLDRTIPKGC